MPTVQDVKQVNRELQRLGFGTLKDPTLADQFAACIRDHAHFRGILMHIPQGLDRANWYQALSLKLRFKAKPLADYELESRQLAEKNQLPEYNPTTLEVKEWKPQEIETQEHKLARLAEKSIAQDLREQGATQQLRLTCRQCTFEQVFRVKRRSSAYKLARQDGWQVDKHTALCRSCKPKPALN